MIASVVKLMLIGLFAGVFVPLAIVQTEAADGERAAWREDEAALDAEPPADPLVRFNEPMFSFNLKLDDYVLRPVASGYDRIMPDGGKRGVDRFLRNLGVVERFANNLFQGKVRLAGQEVGRFVVNTTMGGIGFFDVAEPLFGWKESSEDFGQTLGVYGVGRGPYLMLPFYGPSTVRDTVGFAVDGALNPMNYFLSRWTVFAIRGGVTTANAVNYRAMNMELFNNVDRYTLDLYGAVQDAYLQRREQEIKE